MKKNENTIAKSFGVLRFILTISLYCIKRPKEIEIENKIKGMHLKSSISNFE